MDDVRGDFLGPLHGTTPAAGICSATINDETCRERQEHLRRGPILIEAI